MRKRSDFDLEDAKVRFIVLYKSLIVISLCFIVYQVFTMQVIAGDKLNKTMIDNMTDYITIRHPRGTIRDRNGVVLAKSIMRPSLCCDPSKIIDINPARKGTPAELDMRDLAAEKLQPILKMKKEELLKIFHKKNTKFEWIKHTLEPEEYAALRKAIEKYELNGFYIRRENKRFYPKGTVAAHVLGFMSADDKGASGLEYHLDKELKGIRTFGTKIYNGHSKQIYDDNVKDSVEYRNAEVLLTIDNRMQYTLEEALSKSVKAYQAKGAAAIIMDPYTGEILSMASLPTFDPNYYEAYPREIWTNKCINTVYEPGSVFKPIVGCIGMTMGVVDAKTNFYDLGYIKIADRTFYNWDREGAGWITFTDVMKNSVNTGMIELGKKIGKKAMVEGAENFGFGQSTGIDLPGEADGILYSKEMWDPDLASFAIGQGIAVTPLQELRAICAIANGGELVKPYIVKEIKDAEGQIIHEGKKEVVRNVITEATAREMRQMMEKVVSEGGGKKASIPGYRIAGKTGTAEKKAVNGGYAKGEYITSFVGFVPADKPKYAMLVMVDTPKGSNIYGSQVAAPIFKDVLQQILNLTCIPPDNDKSLASIGKLESGTKGASERTKLKLRLEFTANKQVKLPDFTGADISTTMEVLEKGRLRLRPKGSGYAYKQEPAAGTAVAPGTVVKVWYKR